MSDLDDTIPPPLRATALGRTTTWSGHPSSSVRVDAYGLSERGSVRKDNQDHFYMSRLGRFSQTIATSLPPDPPWHTEPNATFAAGEE